MKISLLIFAIVSIHAVVGASQEAPLEQRILHPVGTPTRPILLNPTLSKEAVSRPQDLPIARWVTFSNFMARVEEANVSLAAQRYNLPIAQAQLTAASAFPDPVLQTGYAGDVSGSGQPSTYAVSVAQPFLLGGKRHYRRDAAGAALLATSASLSDYLRNLRAQAAETFIDALTDFLILNQLKNSLDRAHQLVELNVERVRRGEASEDALMRARIAELEAHNALDAAQSDYDRTLGQIAILMGVTARDGLIGPKGDLEGVSETFSLALLLERAATSRSYVVAAQYVLQDVHAGYQLAKARRIPDITIQAGYSHLTRVTNPIDHSPAWEQAGVSLSLPLTIFSTLNGGAIQVAHYQELQAEKSLQAAKLQAQSEVRTAYQHYLLTVNEVQLFGSELLKDSGEIYRSRLFRLQKGQVSLLDVLDAHQALVQLHLDYYNALGERAKALVGLEQATGIWDVDF